MSLGAKRSVLNVYILELVVVYQDAVKYFASSPYALCVLEFRCRSKDRQRTLRGLLHLPKITPEKKRNKKKKFLKIYTAVCIILDL